MNIRDLEKTVETGHFLLPEVPGEFQHLSITGVQGHMAAVSHLLANTVGAATLDEQTVDSVIQEVLKTYQREQKTFLWRVGPYSRPVDLGKRLVKAGMTPFRTIAGLFIAGWEALPPVAGTVSIRQATPADRPMLEEFIRRSHPIHAPWASTRSKALLPDHDSDRTLVSTYLAYVAAQEGPVGMATMNFIPELPVVYLGGAATDPAFRRHGIYRSLMAHRLHAAQQRGARAAVIQANKESAQACEKLGFSHFCEIDTYIWKSEHDGQTQQ